jgi:hypothetical protein
MTKPATSSWSAGSSTARGAEQRGEDAAAVDVAHDNAGQVRRPGQAKVDEVVLAQVDFGGATGALTDYRVELLAKLHKRLQGGSGETLAHVVEVRRVD